MVSWVGLSIVALLVVAITHYFYFYTRRNFMNRGGVLPPGSFGLPIIGETIQLIIPNYSLDISSFITKRLAKYGPVFRTSVAGRLMVISADLEVNQFILRQDGKSVELWYLDLFAKMFNNDGEERPDGAYIHKYIRHLALGQFGSESLKAKLFFEMEEMVNITLSSWASQGSVEIKYASSAMAIELGARQLFSYDPEKSSIKLIDSFANITKALMSFPLNIPGTTYHRCLKDYEKAKELMMNIVKERLASGETKADLLDDALRSMDIENFVTPEYVAQLIFGYLYAQWRSHHKHKVYNSGVRHGVRWPPPSSATVYASFDSVSTTIALALKLLLENPTVLDDLTAEHEALVKRRVDPDSPISWEEYKSMPFTLYVINETLRIGSFIPGIMRRAKQDIQVNGYTIPAGWGIIILSSALHLNPKTFEDPLAFNPWRWKDVSTSVMSKNFMPFGWGMRQCAGADYSRMLLSIFLHIIVTKYKWTKIKGGDVVRTPILQFTNGFHINISQKTVN